MLNKPIMLIFLLLLIAPMVSSQEDLGIFEQHTPVRLIQSCSSCSYVTLDSVKLPNATLMIINTNMTKDGSTFYYDFSQTNLSGKYIYNTHYENWTAPVSFEITLNGKEKAEGITVVIYTILFMLFLVFGLVYFIKSFVHVFSLDMDIIDATIMIATYIGVWIFYYFSFEYLGNEIINSLLETAISVGAVTHVFLPLVGFLVSFIMTNLKAKKKSRVTY